MCIIFRCDDIVVMFKIKSPFRDIYGNIYNKVI